MRGGSWQGHQAGTSKGDGSVDSSTTAWGLGEPMGVEVVPAGGAELVLPLQRDPHFAGAGPPLVHPRTVPVNNILRMAYTATTPARSQSELP